MTDKEERPTPKPSFEIRKKQAAKGWPEKPDLPKQPRRKSPHLRAVESIHQRSRQQEPTDWEPLVKRPAEQKSKDDFSWTKLQVPPPPGGQSLGSNGSRSAKGAKFDKLLETPEQIPNIKKDSGRKERPRRSPEPKPTPRILYLVRLVIFGIGIGAITGTILSVADPANQQANISQVNPTSAMTTTTPARPSPTEMADLKAKIAEVLKPATKFQAGVFVVDLDNNTFVDINADTPYPAASTIKFPVLVAFLQDVDSGKVSLDESLILERKHLAQGSGDLQEQPANSRHQAWVVAEKMMIISDNTATNMLLDRLGGLEALNQRFQSWGLINTKFQAPLPDLGGTNLSTPKELTQLMVMIEQGSLLSRRSRDRLLDIMQRTENRSLLPQGIDKNAKIAHKTGNIATLVADVGLVDLPSGKRYAIAIMVKRPRNDQQALELVRQISRMVYTHLSAGSGQ